MAITYTRLYVQVKPNKSYQEPLSPGLNHGTGFSFQSLITALFAV